MNPDERKAYRALKRLLSAARELIALQDKPTHERDSAASASPEDADTPSDRKGADDE